MPKNKAAQMLGKLRGKMLTSEHQQRSAEKRWGDDKARQEASKRMRQYWIGWRKAKEAKGEELKKSAKKGIEMN